MRVGTPGACSDSRASSADISNGSDSALMSMEPMSPDEPVTRTFIFGVSLCDCVWSCCTDNTRVVDGIRPSLCWFFCKTRWMRSREQSLDRIAVDGREYEFADAGCWDLFRVAVCLVPRKGLF